MSLPVFYSATLSRLSRVALLLLTLLLLAACASRPTLSGQPVYRLSVPALLEAIENAEFIPVELEGNLYLGFSSQGEHAWYSLQAIDQRVEQGTYITLARLNHSHRFRPYFRSGQAVTLVGQEELQATFDQLFEWLLPTEPNLALHIQTDEGERFVWRDKNGAMQVATELGAAVDVYMSLGEEQLLLRVLSLLEREDESVLLTLAADEPGAIGWAYLPAGGNAITLIQLPVKSEGSSTPVAKVTLKSLDHLVIRSHLITLIKNPVSTFRRLLGHGEDAIVSLFRRGPEAVYPSSPLAQGASMDLEAWEHELDVLTHTRSYPGTIDFLVGGEAFFERLETAFHQAQKRIDIRTYIFDNDAFAVRIADEVKRLSSEVKVRVMMDDLGSIMAGLKPPPGGYPANHEPPGDMVRYLKKDSSVKARRVGNPWLTGDHVKLSIVDRERAFVGGMNYGAEYRYHWHDLMVEVQGPIVWRLQKEFDKAWAHAGPGGDFAYLIRALRLPTVSAELSAEYPVPLRVLQTRTGKREILRAHLAAIDYAQRYIYIATPYFSEPAVINKLISARARGVDVRVILPEQGNHGIMNSVNVFTANQLLEGGVRIYMYPGMSHLKAAVFDGWASFGSANFDRLSMKVNQELNLATSHPETVKQLLEQVFEPHILTSQELLEPLPWDWSDTMAGALAKPF